MDNCTLWDNHNTILDHPIPFIHLGAAWERFYDHSFANAGIFIDDGAFDMTIFAYPQGDVTGEVTARGIVII